MGIDVGLDITELQIRFDDRLDEAPTVPVVTGEVNSKAARDGIHTATSTQLFWLVMVYFGSIPVLSAGLFLFYVWVAGQIGVCK